MKREQMKNITIDGVEYTPVIKEKVTFEIAKKDFPKRMKWKDAVKACTDLGNGWRLPTKDEFWDLIYENKDKIGGFANSNYWSSTEGVNLGAWYQNFNTGNQFNGSKDTANYVRAVRDIK